MLNRIKALFGAGSTKEQEFVTIVSGLPRSGTSMMMQLLEAGGMQVLTDFQRTADSDNPKGYYEYERVKKLREGDIAWLPEARGKVVKVIAALLPYLPPRYSYRIILMRRAMPEILASQRKMLQNRGEDPDSIDDEKLGRLFEAHLQKVYEWIGRQKNIQMLEIDYNQLLGEPIVHIQKVNRFLGEVLDEKKMATVVDPALYRQRKAS